MIALASLPKSEAVAGCISCGWVEYSARQNPDRCDRCGVPLPTTITKPLAKELA